MCLTTSGLRVYGDSPLVVICIVLFFFISRPMNQIYEDVIGVTRSLRKLFLI